MNEARDSSADPTSEVGRPRGIHVELLGVPGAGKTTLFTYVMDALTDAGFAVRTIDEAVFQALRRDMVDRAFGPLLRGTPRRIARRLSKHVANRSQDRMVALRDFLLDRPDVVVAVLEAIVRRRATDLRSDLAMTWILDLVWQYQLAKPALEDPGTALVFDEGFCNRAVSLFGHGFSVADEPLLRRYIDAIPAPDLVVVVHADTTASAARATDRRRYRSLDADAIITYTASAARCVRRTKDLLVSQRGLHVVDVPNHGCIDESVAHLRSGIHEWLAGRR